MRIWIYIVISGVMGVVSCSKDKTPLPPPPEEPEVWEKFIGNYNVYDTNGNYLYQMEIENFYHDDYVDSLIITNFNQNFDLKFQFQLTTDEEFLNIGFHDSIKGYDDKTWQITSKFDDLSTPVLENRLSKDTMIFYFKQTNIQYWITEGVPYFFCECKQVAVKQ